MSIDGNSRKILSDKLINLVLGWEYGFQLSHAQIQTALGIELDYPDYYSVISKANKQLEYVGKKLVSVYDFGYKVLEPDKYNPHSIKVFSSGYKRIRRANKIITNAPVDLMSDGAREDQRNISGRMDRYVSIIKKQKVELVKITRTRTITDRSTERVGIAINPQTI